MITFFQFFIRLYDLYKELKTKLGEDKMNAWLTELEGTTKLAIEAKTNEQKLLAASKIVDVISGLRG